MHLSSPPYVPHVRPISFFVDLLTRIMFGGDYISLRSLLRSFSHVVVRLRLKCDGTCAVCVLLFFCALDAGLLAKSQYSEGPATGHLDTGFSRFSCVYKQMLRWFPTFQVATTCFSCSPPDLNLVVTNFMFCLHVK